MAYCASIFRSYDIRGISGTEVTAALAYDLGAAIGTRLARQGVRSAVVGRDNRHSGVWLQTALVEGLVATGCQVARLGMVPTPMVYWASRLMDAGAAIQITGSHNPVNYNGFKIMLGGRCLQGEDIQALRRDVNARQFVSQVGSSDTWRIEQRYLTDLTHRIDGSAPTLKVVVDAGNGAAGPSAVVFLRMLGHDVIPLHCTPDGRYPNHHPDPTVDANLNDLRWAVQATGADLGVAFDGDGDRLGAVDAKGNTVRGDQLLTLFAADMLQRHPEATIIGEVKCSRVFFEEVERLGGKSILCRTGHAPIKQKMRETGALLAGEMSGHFFFADRYFGFDDATYAAARLLELVGRSRSTLESLVGALPKTYASPEHRVPCPDSDKWAVMASLRAAFYGLYARKGCASLVEVDGVRVEWKSGWGLVRASNTEPSLVTRFEANTPEELARIKGVFRDVMRHVMGPGADSQIMEGVA